MARKTAPCCSRMFWCGRGRRTCRWSWCPAPTIFSIGGCTSCAPSSRTAGNRPAVLLVKSLHLVFMITWFAGLFYLPRLFVYHAQAAADDRIGIERFKTMERKLYFGIMAPGAILTVLFGAWMWLGYGVTGAWLHAKITFVLVLIA